MLNSNAADKPLMPERLTSPSDNALWTPEANHSLTADQQLTCDAIETQSVDAQVKTVEDPREKAQIDLLTFTQHTKPNYLANWHHKTLAEKLDRMAAGDCRRLMVFMPPQHGKSELVSRRFPAYIRGRKDRPPR